MRRAKGKEVILQEIPIPHIRKTSLASKIMKATIEVLRQEGILRQGQLILKLIVRYPEIKEYYARVQNTGYFRKIFQRMVREGLIVKVRELGDRKHVYYALPETLEKYKDKIVKGKIPKA